MVCQKDEPGAGLHTRRVHVGGHTVDVRGTFAPERPPIVLVHGIGMSGEYFLPYGDLLAVTHDVYTLDLPGYGSTPQPVRALTVPELSDVVVGVVTTLGLDAPVLVGHSMGCQIVADAIADHPGLCAGYMLIGPTVDPAARSLHAQGMRLLRDTLIESPLSNAVVFRNYLRMGPLRYLRTARHMLADHTEETIPRCTVPGLVVRGARDPIASAEWVRLLVRLAPDAALREIPGGSHNVQHIRPHDLAAACAPFLAAVNGGRPGPQTTSPSA
ncbi:alpha/beta fold hydrolase [Brachybacterium sp. AOP42-B2-9]|uniref:alpha/beta fold hydrolase n=1 Tax=Brachybacterium sp. AOP42-B2-9 TaxID=3457672 RepID=UPI004034470F